MRIPKALAEAFGDPFEALLGEFLVREKSIATPEDLRAPRFLARSIVPHVERLSTRFNRLAIDPHDPNRKVVDKTAEGLKPYWAESSNPANQRLAYFLGYMPGNLFRVAAVWAELNRLGFRWPFGGTSRIRALEFGAGPASGACGIAAAEALNPVGMGREGDWALIEQDKKSLELGSRWAETYFKSLNLGWTTRKFHRRILETDSLLPRTAPKFHLWVMSYFLNERADSAEAQARVLVEAAERHLEEEGMIVLVEPALRLESRRLLSLRKALLELGPKNPLQVLLPCLGHQACGALANGEDWCHEEVTWWRPQYLREIDRLAGLDRKSLPFSYLVLTKSKRPRSEILPGIQGFDSTQIQRLVSPVHHVGSDGEFFVCGQDGKRRARWRPDTSVEGAEDLGRGDLLLGSELRGDPHASRVQTVTKIG